jgi:hypothetical protein
MSISERERSAYRTYEGAYRVYCGRCDILQHVFYGYTKREAARAVERGEACYFYGPR